MSRLVRLLLYTSDGDNAFISNPLCLKMLEGVNLTIWLYPLWISQKWSSERNGKALLFATFSEDMKIFTFNLAWCFLVTKKLLTLAYNRCYQQLFSFNLLEIGCLIVKFISALDYFFLKNGKAWNSESMTWNCCRLISLKSVASLTDCSYGKSNNQNETEI